MSSERVWLITGASRGLGRALAEAALRKGDIVAAAAEELARRQSSGKGAQPVEGR
jgi:NAD(P)-dependent dehydrogenase (short-subunit alcohol dehydrogenase family)